MEIERKWLIRKEQIPYDLEKLPSHEIEQCYVSFSPVIRIRKINHGERYILTVKSTEQGISRQEFELPLSGEEYENLYQKREGNMLQKTRYLKEENGLVQEIDIFRGDLEGLCYMEIEFPTKEAAETYPTPDWVVADVSDRIEYANASLARHGHPTT